MIGRITLPGTNLNVSRLSFGTASLHHLYSSRSRQKILQAAFDAGITHFDASPYYGYGLAEQELGLFQSRNRRLVTVATKVGRYPPGACCPGTPAVWMRIAMGKVFPAISAPVINWSILAAERSLESSLRRLRAECVDILFLHEPNPAVVRSDEFLGWLDAQRRKGKIRDWGLAGQPEAMESWLSTNHPIGAILQVKDSLQGREADIVLRNNRALQITYGYLSSRENSSGVKTGPRTLMQALKRNRTGTVVFSTRRLDRIAALSSLNWAELL